MDVNQLNLTFKKGNQVKQGDTQSQFVFELRDYRNKLIKEHDGKNALVKIGNVYQEEVVVTGHEVVISIKDIIEIGKYPIEIYIEDYIFPSDHSTYIVVKKGIKDFQPVQLYEVMKMTKEELDAFLQGKIYDDSKIIASINQLTDYSKGFRYDQESSMTEWRIVHNLNKYPQVTVVDSAKSVVIGEVQYISLNEIVVRFTFPFSGSAFLN